MRFSTVSAAMAVVGGVSALPQSIGNNVQPAPAIPIEFFDQLPTRVVPLSLGDAKQKFANVSNTPLDSFLAFEPAAAADTCSNPRTRPEWDQLGDGDKMNYVNAIKCLMTRPASGSFFAAKSRYEDFVQLHQFLYNYVHGNDIFLVWHRYYLWTFESVLRSECGFSSDLPWWDEAKYAGRFPDSSLLSSNYFGSVNTGGGCVTDGQFNAQAYTLNIGPGFSNTPHCLSRNYDVNSANNDNQGYIDLCNGMGDYHSMADCSEHGNHAYGHNGVGGVMSDAAASPGDPLFFLHHAFVDRMYYNWQTVDASRRDERGLNGQDANHNNLTPDTQLDVGGIRPTVTIRDVLDTQGQTLCYRYSY